MKDINSGNICKFERMIEEAERICIVTHMKPDGDAIGSATAMYHFLSNSGKSPRIILNDPYPSYLSFLITPGLSEDIYIFEDQPEAAQREITRSDLIICLDFNAFHRTDRLERPLKESEGRKILIDHHLNPARELFDLSFSETEISSASELLYHILLNTTVINNDAARLGEKCAQSLMTGMTTDTVTGNCCPP